METARQGFIFRFREQTRVSIYLLLLHEYTARQNVWTPFEPAQALILRPQTEMFQEKKKGATYIHTMVMFCSAEHGIFIPTDHTCADAHKFTTGVTNTLACCASFSKKNCTTILFRPGCTVTPVDPYVLFYCFAECWCRHEPVVFTTWPSLEWTGWYSSAADVHNKLFIPRT